MEMSVTRGLAELKLLADRIEKTIENGRYVVLKIGDKTITGYKSDEDFVNGAKATYDSALALIKRKSSFQFEKEMKRLN